MAEGAADLPVALLVIVGLLTGGGLVLLLRRMPWEALFVPGRAELFVAALLTLLLIWSLRAQVVDGLALHLMGMAAVTLIFGWQLAILLAFLVTGMLGLFGVLPMAAVPLTVLLAGALPVAVTWGLLRLTETRFPPHMFIYLYGVAFLGGALSAAVTVLGTGVIHALFTELAWSEVYRDYVRYLPLLVLPESVVNGIVITAMVVLRPGWLATWSDERYLHGR